MPELAHCRSTTAVLAKCYRSTELALPRQVLAGGVLGSMAAVVLLGLLGYRYKLYQQTQQMAGLLSKLNSLESQVVEVCKQGFAQLQAGQSLQVRP